MEELVSIIMPSYNTAAYIAESIKSVLKQTYSNWELIIVDDCSNDATDSVIAPFLLDNRIHYFKNSQNLGAAVTRNKALRESRGKWIAFLDSDDLWSPYKLQKQIDFMNSNNYHFSYTNYCEINENSEELGTLITGPKKINQIAMYFYCWPGCLTVMYDSKYVGLVQIYDIKKNNDYAMWLEIIGKTDCYLLDECLAKYRKRKGSISNQKYIKLIKWHYKLFRNARGKSVISSALLTIVNIFFALLKKGIYVKMGVI